MLITRLFMRGALSHYVRSPAIWRPLCLEKSHRGCSGQAFQLSPSFNQQYLKQSIWLQKSTWKITSITTIPTPTTWDSLNYLRHFSHCETEKESFAPPIPDAQYLCWWWNGYLMPWCFKVICFIFTMNERGVEGEDIRPRFPTTSNSTTRIHPELKMRLSRWPLASGWNPKSSPGPLSHAIWNNMERYGYRDCWRLAWPCQFTHKRKRPVSRRPQVTAKSQSVLLDTDLWQ